MVSEEAVADLGILVEDFIRRWKDDVSEALRNAAREVNFHAMRKRAGFTLLEVCLAVLIALFLVTMAVPSVAGLFADRRIRKSFDAMDDLVREAQQRSIEEHRPFVLEWEKERVVLRPLEPDTPGEERGLKEIPMADDNTYALELPAALVKKPEPVWTFWPTGTCEPAVILHEGEAGKWLARYDPLTVRATLEQ